MQDKLELKHLAAYLPYGLKWLTIQIRRSALPFSSSWDYVRDGYITELDHKMFSQVMDELEEWPFEPHKRKYCLKPILLPLSDLTKEIEVNGEKFVPSNFLSDKSRLAVGCHIRNWNSGVKSIESMPVYDYNKLLEWHFDVFGLIEKNLAININLLSQKSDNISDEQMLKTWKRWLTQNKK